MHYDQLTSRTVFRFSMTQMIGFYSTLEFCLVINIMLCRITHKEVLQQLVEMHSRDADRNPNVN